MDNFQLVLTTANILAIAAVVVAIIRQAFGVGRYTRNIETTTERLMERISGIEQSREAVLTERAKSLDAQLSQIHKRLDRIENRLDEINKGLR